MAISHTENGKQSPPQVKRSSLPQANSEKRISSHTKTSTTTTNTTTASSKPSSSPPTKSNDKKTETSANDDDGDDDWESMFDDNGECLDPKIIDEISSAVGKVSIAKPKSDYKETHQPINLEDEEFPHVLEVSNFPVEFKTPDLLMTFSAYKEAGFDIKWVDDTHALVVFSNSKIGTFQFQFCFYFVCLNLIFKNCSCTSPKHGPSVR